MADKFKNIAYSGDSTINYDTDAKVHSNVEDPIRKLLNNIISYIDDKKPSKTIHRNAGVGSAFDAISSSYASVPSKSGFDINEALNPTEDLEDILKSFNLKRKAK